MAKPLSKSGPMNVMFAMLDHLLKADAITLVKLVKGVKVYPAPGPFSILSDVRALPGQAVPQ